jgi:hypothetical protein
MEPQAPPLGKHQPPRQCENTGEIISPHPQKLTWATPTNVASQQLEHVCVTDVVIPEGNGVDWLPQLSGEGPRDMPEVLGNKPHGWPNQDWLVVDIQHLRVNTRGHAFLKVCFFHGTTRWKSTHRNADVE